MENEEILKIPDPQPHPSALLASSSSIPGPPLSKNAQKKLAKAAILAEKRKEKRAYQKEKKKEAKRLQAASKQSEGEDVVEGEERDGEEVGDDVHKRKRARLEEGVSNKRRRGGRKPFKARVVIDLGFDDLMSENEIKSLTSQLAFTYSANRKTSSPFESVLFTSLTGRTHDRLEGISDAAYKRWEGTEWWDQSYEMLWSPEEAPSESASTSEQVPSKKRKPPQKAPKESVIYLTADSDYELTELKEGETYIIGGICDHNRYKNLCLKKSVSTGIKSARLPIGTYLSQLKTRKVLTVNQTFEILLKWVETRDWEKALFDVVPKRKFQEGNKGQAQKQGKGEDTALQTEQVVLSEDVLEDGEPMEAVEGEDESIHERVEEPKSPVVKDEESTHDRAEDMKEPQLPSVQK